MDQPLFKTPAAPLGALCPVPHGAFPLLAAFDARAGDFWAHAFACFPQRDYGVLTVPSGVLTEPTLVRGLTAAVLLPGASFSHTLYVAHRDGLLAPRHLAVQRWLPSTAQVG